jgi:DNA-binding MarR family transcriptional regulator
VFINTPLGDGGKHPFRDGGMNWDMKNPINGLNKVFDNRIRLGVMSVLMVNEEVNFNDLKQMLEVTDGNLATHLVNLEDNGYIKVHKGFIGRKTNTTYAVTKTGEKAFSDHIAALENMIKGVK